MSFTREELKGTDLIVLNGLNEISSGLASELVEFKNQGGSLFIFPGKEKIFKIYVASPRVLQISMTNSQFPPKLNKLFN